MSRHALIAFVAALAMALGSIASIGWTPAAHAADAIDALPFKNQAQELRFQKLTKQLRCLVCQDESLYDSNAGLAKQMRLIVFQKMNSGWSDAKIKQYLVDRYSDYVLYKPPLRPFTWLLWFGPIIIGLLGLLAVAVTIHKRRRHAPLTVPELDDEDW